jgi:hypothetical protein
MRPVFVVIADVLAHEAFEMALVQDDHLVKRITAAAAKEALGDAVLPWAFKCGSLRLYAEALDRADNFLTEITSASKIRYLGAES